LAVKLRMKMFGRKNRPEFRIVAADARSPRDGSIIENLGFYHPLEKDAAKVLRMNEERVKYWLSVGAQPSETLVSIFKKRGILRPWIENEKARSAKFFAERRTKKGKGPRVARPKGEAKPKPAPKAATEGGPEGPTTEAKAAAAASKAAKREAKKAK